MRLIDADALKAQIEKEVCKDGWGCDNYNVVRCRSCEIGEALTYLDEAPTVCEWISVKNRLPEKEGRYLVLTSGIIGIEIAWFTSSLKQCFEHAFEDGEPDRPGFFDCDSEDDWILDDVMCWMPLPEIPKEESKK